MNTILNLLEVSFKSNAAADHTPKRPIGKGEKILGVIKERPVQHLFECVHATQNEKRNLATLAGRAGHPTLSPAQCLTNADRRAVLMQHLFWNIIREEYGSGSAHGHNALGIRKDWVVVSFHHPSGTDEPGEDDHFCCLSC